ncbi:hypothetical protein [uncultured Algibacter sp.]|uniref:hypothetical protein n=1 Tax=uncultured Algibacter sp. TaxID=298659 RepID=UPI00261D113F|nr:hypothetical protein [uncultured Algibacter sp.]
MIKHYKYIFILFLVSNALTSCKKTQESSDFTDIKQFVEKLDQNLEQYNWIVVLPGLGCKGCIKQAEMFIKENIAQKKVLFVLTKVESLKTLQNKIGIKVKDHSNIYIDREDDFIILSDNSIYPCIISLENGKTQNYQFQSPDNGEAFVKLSTQIKALAKQ